MPAENQTRLVAFAPAKVNLTLRVLRRRPDGYHELDSLVVFADVGDVVTLAPGEPLSLTVDGPTADNSGITADNLVLKAARGLAARIDGLRLGHFHLEKRLPVAAGLGGGSSDAAAALRLLAQVNGIAIDDPRLREAAAATGADVPVCLDPRPRIMRGIGDVLSEPLLCPPLPAVLVNPRVAVATRDVFGLLRIASDDGAAPAPSLPRATLMQTVMQGTNDLQRPALFLQPVISDVLAALAALPGSTAARMSGSGATCFALFDDHPKAVAGAESLRARHPAWWVEATTLGAGAQPV